jgi:hypothetical protein
MIDQPIVNISIPTSGTVYEDAIRKQVEGTQPIHGEASFAFSPIPQKEQTPSEIVLSPIYGSRSQGNQSQVKIINQHVENQLGNMLDQSVQGQANRIDTATRIREHEGLTPQPISIAGTFPSVMPTDVILREPAEQSPHIIIDAKPGTGKTFTAQEIAYRMCGIRRPGIIGSPEQETIWASIPEQYNPKSICEVAFNRNIKKALAATAPPNVNVMTVHGLGKMILGFNRIGTGKYGVYKKKYNKTFAQLEKITSLSKHELFGEFKGPMLYGIGQMVSLLKVNLFQLSSDYADCKSRMQTLVETHGMTLPEFKDASKEDFLYTCAIQVYGSSHEWTKCIDFDDMIWMPIKLNIAIRPYEVMIVDERQDLNLAQQELVCRSGRRLIIVGDEKQAIYGFAGADVQATKRMEDRLSRSVRGHKQFPLTYTRRCSKAVVRFNQSIDPDFHYFNENQEGGLYQDDETTFLPKVALGDMVVCRTNAPLFTCCLQLLQKGIPFKTTIRSFFEDTINLIESFECTDLADLSEHLDEWKEKRLAKCSDEFGIIVEDQVAAIKYAINTSRDLNHLCEMFRAVFELGKDDDDGDGYVSPKWIFLTSIHQAKGLEAERVWWLQHDLVPHPKAKLLEQETNLRWVAGTRAIRDLILVKSKPKKKSIMDDEE